MQVLAISRRRDGADVTRLAALARAETQAAWALYAGGTARAIHFDARQSRGILTLEVADLDAARAALATLPTVAEGLIDFDLYELGPYRQLQNLFA